MAVIYNILRTDNLIIREKYLESTIIYVHHILEMKMVSSMYMKYSMLVNKSEFQKSLK